MQLVDRIYGKGITCTFSRMRQRLTSHLKNDLITTKLTLISPTKSKTYNFHTFPKSNISKPLPILKKNLNPPQKNCTNHRKTHPISAIRKRRTSKFHTLTLHHRRTFSWKAINFSRLSALSVLGRDRPLNERSAIKGPGLCLSTVADRFGSVPRLVEASKAFLAPEN